ncbi:MAG: PKD domain-containing protein, partial [Myxococcota bacterium]
HPTQEAIYGADNGLSPSDIEKYDISGGTAAVMYDSPYHGDFAMCGDLWFTNGGERIVTRCGNVFRATADQNTDMNYNGMLSETPLVGFVHDTASSDAIAVIPGYNFWNPTDDDTAVQFYGKSYLSYLGSEPVTEFPIGSSGETTPGHGRFVFWRSDGAVYYVLLQADEDSGVLNDWAIDSMAAPVF